MPHFLLCRPDASPQMRELVTTFLSYGDFVLLESMEALGAIKIEGEVRLVICCDLDWKGTDGFVADALDIWAGVEDLSPIIGSFIVYSQTQWYTKRYSQSLIFTLNQRGMGFLGHCVFEVLPDFENFKTWQEHLGLPLDIVWKKRLLNFHHQMSCDPFPRGLGVDEGPSDRVGSPRKLVVLHASHHPISNTLNLWQMVDKHLEGFDKSVFAIANGSVSDCKGCAYKTCVHYGQTRSCYYGGQITDEVLPAIENADVVVWVSPNYNDAISAMHTALINRLTVLYRRVSLRKKRVYGVIVSGNSGGDSVACQLIGALNLNKGFALPSRAFLTAIASAPGSINTLPHIEKEAERFAHLIMHQ